MFATPDDPPGLADVRLLEVAHANMWAAEARAHTLGASGEL
jgi:hypothetical protein